MQGVAEILQEEGLLNAEAMQQLDELDTMTGTPVEEDVVTFAVAVCAPWSAVQAYKYRVKLTPGKMKKGQAVKQIRDIMLKNREALPLERQCIKLLPDSDMIRTILSNATVGSGTKSKGGGGSKGGKGGPKRGKAGKAGKK
eukprot:COSAG05_NODE_785_length_7361_cov_460.024397_4_plen_141_part_00